MFLTVWGTGHSSWFYPWHWPQGWIKDHDHIQCHISSQAPDSFPHESWLGGKAQRCPPGPCGLPFVYLPGGQVVVSLSLKDPLENSTTCGAECRQRVNQSPLPLTSLFSKPSLQEPQVSRHSKELASLTSAGISHIYNNIALGNTLKMYPELELGGNAWLTPPVSLLCL